MIFGIGSHEPVRVLVIDDDASARRVTLAALREHFGGALTPHDAPRLDAGLAILATQSVVLVVVALECAGPHAGTEAIRAVRASGFGGALLATSRSGSVSLAVEAMRAGADDLLIKPFAPLQLVRRLSGLLSDAATTSAPMPAPAACETAFEGFIGRSPAMQAIYGQIARLAPSRAPVFVTGESGTGKEVAAEAIHRRSPRARGPFIALNCGAIPKELMESEIFGHLKGAFTGAHEDRPGAAEAADGGTLFLDEICEMDLALQAKLLRFIQTGEVRRVGDTRARSVDVRFVCATNRDPLADVAAGRFREDLYYRLHVLPLAMPPLRGRGDDVVLLARAFLARFAEEEGRAFRGFDAPAERLIAAYDWPGNVRQLQNVIRRVVVLHDGAVVAAAMLGLPAAGVPLATHEPARDTGPWPRAADGVEPFLIQEQRIIERALAAFGGNIAQAAAALGIAPSTIYRKKQSWAQASA